MPAAGERAADPVEHAAAGFVPGSGREVVEAGIGEVGAQRLGEGYRIGREILVHRGLLVRGLGAAGGGPGRAARAAQGLSGRPLYSKTGRTRRGAFFLVAWRPA